MSHSYQQEFLSELETGTELLQNHAQLVLGNTLSHSILQKMEADSQSARNQDHSFKVGVSDVSLMFSQQPQVCVKLFY